MNYLSSLWGKKKPEDNENHKLNETLNTKEKTTTVNEKTSTASTASTASATKEVKEKTSKKDNSKGGRRIKPQEKKKDDKPQKMIELILDPPINHVEITPELFDSLTTVYRFDKSSISPTFGLWINGALGGSVGYVISNSIFKNNPLQKFKSTMIIGSTFMGAYYLANRYYERIDFDRKNLAYKKDYYIIESDAYLSKYIESYLLKKSLNNSKYRIAPNGDIVDSETGDVKIKKYDGFYKKHFKPLSVDSI